MDLSAAGFARLVAALFGVTAAWNVGAVVSDIDSAELSRLIAAGVPIIDIRTSPEWQQTGVVPGSHLLTFFDERGRANPGAWLEKAGSIARPGDPLIVICRTGNRTKAVSQFLSDRAGYAKVYNVKEGIVAWTKEGRATEPVSQSRANCRAADNC